MRLHLLIVPIVCAIVTVPLRGEVVESSATGFSVRNVATISAPPAKVYAALTDHVDGWWDPVHTFSHDSHNLTLDAKPGGCFCERLPDGGGVEHMRVVFASPGKLLRLTGAIGPLQEAAVTGTMTWNLSAAGTGTTVELTYTVGGFRVGGFHDLPTVVDGVLRGQLGRLKAFVETGHAGTPAPPDACATIDGVDRVLAPKTVALFGELHGTNEAPGFVGNVLCQAAARHVPVTLGVELPKESTPALMKYVKSAGTAADKTALLADSAWHIAPPDGRTSEAMFALVESARQLVAKGGDVDVYAFSDTAPTGQERDSLMADNLAKRFTSAPGRVVIVLTGNIHSRVAIGTGFDRAFRPMGYLLRERAPGATVLGLNLTYDSGAAWMCLAHVDPATACGSHAVKGQRKTPLHAIELTHDDAAYDGRFGVPPLTASKPAVQ